MAAFGGGVPVFTGGNKRDRTPYGFLSPLDPLPFALTHRRCAAKRGLRGHDSGRRADLGTLLCPEFTFAWVAAHNSARPDGAGRRRSAAKSSASINRVPLEHQTPLWALAFRRATAGVASAGGFGGVKRGQGNHTVPLPPFVSAGRPRQSPAAGRRPCPACPSAAISRLRRQAAGTAEALSSADGKKYKGAFVEFINAL